MAHCSSKNKLHQTYRALLETNHIYTLQSMLQDSNTFPFRHIVQTQVLLQCGWIYSQKTTLL